MKTLSLFAVVLAGMTSVAAAPLKDRANQCPSEARERIVAMPTQRGPLRLLSTYCLEFGSNSFGVSDPILSPDGRLVAQWHRGSPAPVEIVALSRSGRTSVPNRVGFRNFAPMGDSFGTSPDALAWRRDSRALWTVRQDTTKLGGWSVSGLVPISIDTQGTMRDLPPLRHKAGPLDGLIWAGNDGLAIAQFGTRGQYYRPGHKDRDPTLAMVDTAHGKILASFQLNNVPSLRARIKADSLIVGGTTATIMPDGRMRAVVRFSRWVDRHPGSGTSDKPKPGAWIIWTQGQPPKVWISQGSDAADKPAILSPSGSTLLVIRSLQPDGMQISCRIPCPGPPPPPPTAVSGPVAELIDVASRRTLWRNPAKAKQFWSQNARPAISGDGRYALIDVPPDGDWAPISLIDMRNGRILQTISTSHTWSYPHRFGFTSDGRHVWVLFGNQLLIFSINDR